MSAQKAIPGTPKLPYGRALRARLVARLRDRMERVGYPRTRMSLLVMLTAITGLITSFTLLHLGLTSMGLRYLCAICIAYAAFLFLLWLWLRTNVGDYDSTGDALNLLPSPGSGGGGSMPSFSGGGGTSGGGGASAAFDAPSAGATVVDASADAGASAGDVAEGAGDAAGSVGDADELLVPLLVVAFVGAALLSSLWIIYSAPTLFAEMVVDGILASGLYRKLRGLEPESWLETAVKHTFWPFLLTALLVTGIGYKLQLVAPGAHTLGEAMRYASESRTP